jgi:hypothetical protein
MTTNEMHKELVKRVKELVELSGKKEIEVSYLTPALSICVGPPTDILSIPQANSNVRYITNSTISVISSDCFETEQYSLGEVDIYTLEKIVGFLHTIVYE